jgi:hypothetical protein
MYRGVWIGLFGFLLVFGSVQGPIDAAEPSQDPIEILLLMDHGYGGNVPHILNIFERYGWSYTTTGLNQTLTSCAYLNYQQYTVDILLTDITDITEYYALSILPGDGHDLLRTNQTSLDLINSAVDEDLIVSAWCRGVRVLAAADVIDGKNITGNADYESEYVAAGATFNELVPPIIDGNIVTGVRSRYYREEMCEAIAEALGVYESDAPEILSAVVTPQPSVLGTDVNLTVELTDVSGCYNVEAEVYDLDEPIQRDLELYVQHLTLNETSEGVFSVVIEDLDLGNYTIDITAWDIFLNEIEQIDAAALSVVEILPSTTGNGLDPMLIVVPGAIIGTTLVVVVVVFLRRR